MLASRLFWKLFLSYLALTLCMAVGFGVVAAHPPAGFSERTTEAAVARPRDPLGKLAGREFPAKNDPGTAKPAQKTCRRDQNANQRDGQERNCLRGLGLRSGPSEKRRRSAGDDRSRRKRRGIGGASKPRCGNADAVRRRSGLKGRENAGVCPYGRGPSGVDAEAAGLRNRVFLLAALVGLLASLLTYWIVSRIVRPLVTLTNSAQRWPAARRCKSWTFPKRARSANSPGRSIP